MNTQPTIFDVFISRRFRIGGLLLLGGVIGFSIIMWVLRVPLGISIVLAVVLGAMGMTGAIIESVAKAVTRSRAPIYLRPREPYEFVAYSRGYINLVNVGCVETFSNNCVLVHFKDNYPIALDGEEGAAFVELLNEFATPLWAVQGAKEE